MQFKYVLIPSFKYKEQTIREMSYVADFVIEYANGKKLTVETKGQCDSTAKIKKKLMMKYYPDVDYIWLSHTVKTGWIEYDALQKLRKQNKRNKENV